MSKKKPKTVLNEILEMIKEKEPTLSQAHLALAIMKNAKVFLTADPKILKYRKSLCRKYKINITSDFYEAQDMIEFGQPVDRRFNVRAGKRIPI